MKIIKYLFYFLFILFSCKNDRTQINGSANLAGGEVIRIYDDVYGNLTDSISVKDGKFHKVFEKPHPFIYYFSIKNTKKAIFISPGFDLKIDLRYNPSEDSYHFLISGKGAIENYLIDTISQKVGKLNKTNIYLLPPEVAIKKTDSTFEYINRHLHTSQSLRKYSPAFLEYLTKVLKYNSATFKNQVALQNGIKDRSFLYYLEKMKIWDESFLGMPEYRSFIDSYINIMASRRCDENSTNEEYLDALLSCIKLIPEKSIREHLLFDKIRMFLGADLVANKKHYFDHFIINNTNEKYRAEITEVYLKTLALQPGTKAPSFILLNSNNNPLTIEMLQGSCVYLIFWATWCGPCVKTFPDYKSLASEYKEIKFVYISLDSDENKWKDFSVKHDLHHLNFWLSEGLNSSMAKAYQVETLPRFVLIDKKGYVIQKNAYHPSTKEIRLLLDSLSRKNNLE